MFVAVIVANVIAALFAFLGVGQIICYLSADERPASATQFLFGLSNASWPLAVAVAIYLLVQIATWLEKLYFAGKNDSAAAKLADATPHHIPVARTGKKENTENSETPVFFKAEPVPAAKPVPAPLPDDELDVKSAAAFAAAVDSARNNETEGQKADKHGTDDDWDDETPVLPEKPKSGLSFFKID